MFRCFNNEKQNGYNFNFSQYEYDVWKRIKVHLRDNNYSVGDVFILQGHDIPNYELKLDSSEYKNNNLILTVSFTNKKLSTTIYYVNMDIKSNYGFITDTVIGFAEPLHSNQLKCVLSDSSSIAVDDGYRNSLSYYKCDDIICNEIPQNLIE